MEGKPAQEVDSGKNKTTYTSLGDYPECIKQQNKLAMQQPRSPFTNTKQDSTLGASCPSSLS